MWGSTGRPTVQHLGTRWISVECVCNLMTHGDAREGKWRGNRRMDWVASTLTLPRNVVYPALITLMRTPRLPAVDWTDTPADLNGLDRFGEKQNLVSARVSSRFKRTILTFALRSLCPLDKETWSLNRRLGGLHRRSRRWGRQTKYRSSTGIRNTAPLFSSH